jgi:hypothetical protein
LGGYFLGMVGFERGRILGGFGDITKNVVIKQISN